jgi:single-strand DNA-binding protein
VKGYNQCTFVGNLTRDPELRTVGQKSVCGFGLAVNDSKRADGSSGDVLFLDVEVWDAIAGVIVKWKRKGDPLLVAGKLKVETWVGQDKQKHQRTKLVARDVVFLGEGGGSRERAPEPQPEPVPAGAPTGDQIPF